MPSLVLKPLPVITVPSWETPIALCTISGCGALTSSARSRTPVFAVHRKPVEEPVDWLVSELPTITLPSPLTANAALSARPGTLRSLGQRH